ncbi:MAG: hypothetical protein R3348_04365 [Xanthomonadales bacterium]|nr:hypothetical protein [Xanthomonadales bacterium]
MRAHTAAAPWEANRAPILARAHWRGTVTWVGALSGLLWRLLTVALAGIVAAWLLSNAAGAWLGVCAWSFGLVMLAFAVDEHGPRGGVSAFAGLFCLVLAWLSVSVAAEFGVVAMLTFGSWVGGELARTLRSKTD